MMSEDSYKLLAEHLDPLHQVEQAEKGRDDGQADAQQDEPPADGGNSSDRSPATAA